MNIISDYLNTLEMIPVITDSLIAGTLVKKSIPASLTVTYIAVDACKSQPESNSYLLTCRIQDSNWCTNGPCVQIMYTSIQKTTSQTVK